MNDHPDAQHATVPVEPARDAGGRDERAGLAALVTALGQHIDVGHPGALQAGFEQSLCALLTARSVRLRDLGVASCEDTSPDPQPERIAIEIPTGDRDRRAVLEASFDAKSPRDERSMELLRAGAQVGALVLEAERGRLLAAYRHGARRPSDGAAPLIGSSPVMQSLRERVERVATTDFTVLLEGETGVGKELVARQIHDLSKRRKGPFITINCAAIVESLLEVELFGLQESRTGEDDGRHGAFEHADGGTLFLDEVSDLSMSAQAKLLRAVQELSIERVSGLGPRRVDIRIVAATTGNLSDMVDRGLFRADLFYRLGGVEIRVPALRSRREDILELARYFLARHHAGDPRALAPSVADALLAYEWPGNVRELERVMEYATAVSESARIELDDLPAAVRGEYGRILGPSVGGDDTMRAWGSRYARLVLDRCGNNKRQACRVLGITYHTLQAYLRHGERLHARPPAVTTMATGELSGEAVGT